MKNIAILYICTGKYAIFWKGFFESAEKYFLPECKKEYFLFTDQQIGPINESVHVIYQEKLEWPLITLFRFHIFYDQKEQLEKFDYIFFLNANTQFLENIGVDILPAKEGLLGVLHPGFYDKTREKFTYERNAASLAYIPIDKGNYYFMGAFNGGRAKNYLALIESLAQNIESDIENNIVAIWHDESHLNKYLIDMPVKILSPAYCYPEDWNIPFEKKILILDKNKLGGHRYLRSL